MNYINWIYVRRSLDSFYRIIANRNRKRISRINNIFFGPAVPYNKLTKFGVKYIIDLREDREKGILEIPDALSYYSFPISDDGISSLDEFIHLMIKIDNFIKKALFTYIVD